MYINTNMFREAIKQTQISLGRHYLTHTHTHTHTLQGKPSPTSKKATLASQSRRPQVDRQRAHLTRNDLKGNSLSRDPQAQHQRLTYLTELFKVWSECMSRGVWCAWKPLVISSYSQKGQGDFLFFCFQLVEYACQVWQFDDPEASDLSSLGIGQWSNTLYHR